MSGKIIFKYQRFYQKIAMMFFSWFLIQKYDLWSLRILYGDFEVSVLIESYSDPRQNSYFALPV